MGSAVLGSAESTTNGEEEEQCQHQQDGERKEECSHQSKEGGVRRKEDKREPEVVAKSGKRARHDNKESLEGNRGQQRVVVGKEENDPQLLRVLQVK